ncbi:MAG: hypothetical protein ACE5H2_01555 [Terriglobia bacterium]
MRLRSHLRHTLWLLGVLLLVPPLQAGSLRSDVLYLLPAETGQLVYIDLKEARRSPHYGQLQAQLLPRRFQHFANFLRSMGTNLEEEIEWLAWVFVPPDGQAGERLMGIVEGNFAPERVEQFFLQQNLPIDVYRGQTLFPFGSGVGPQDLFFSFLDASTAVFGTRASLTLLLETRYGAHDNLLQNETLLAQLDEVNGRAPIWAVFDKQYTRYTLAQLIPEAVRFDEFTRVAHRFRHSTLQLHLGREMRIDFQAWCETAMDAQAFSLLVQTGMFVQRWRLREENPELSRVLTNSEVNSVGDRLQVRLTIEEEDLKKLLARRLFLSGF